MCWPLSHVYSRLLLPTAMLYSTPDLALFVHFNNSWSRALQTCWLLSFVYSRLLPLTAMSHDYFPLYLLSSFLFFTIYTMAWTWLTVKKATGGIATHCLLSKSSSASSTPPTTPAVPPATLPTTPPPPPPSAHSPAVPPATLSEQTDFIKNNKIFFCLIHFLSWELTIFLSSAVCSSTAAS